MEIQQNSTDHPDPLRHVVALANAPAWSIEVALEAAKGLDVGRKVRGYERGLAPLAHVEPLDGTGPLSIALEDTLAMIAIKLNPTISAEQSDAWTRTIRQALSDLPGRILKEAAQRALQKSIRFFPEVDGIIREQAAPILERHRVALARLRELQERIEGATRPRLEAPAEVLEIIPVEEVASWQPHMIDTALNKGWIDAATHAAALERKGLTPS